MKGLTIVRKKRPNVLTVNDSLHDAEGEALIRKKFHFMFEHIGYIKQNSVNSFIHMSPSDKLAFIEKFAFQDMDIVKCKRQMNEDIKELLKSDVTLGAKQETLKYMLDKQKLKISNPVLRPTQQFDENYETQLNETRNKLQYEIKTQYTQLGALSEKETQLHHLTVERNQLEKKEKTYPN